MSFFDKIDPTFFTILVSKHKDLYVDLLLQIHDCIYRHGSMRIDKDLLQELLEEYVKDQQFDYDFSDEEEYVHIKNELRQEKEFYDYMDMKFLLRLFEKHKWIHVDLHMETMKKMVSLPYHSRVFITFVHDIIHEREQIGYLIRIHASLKDLDDKMKIEDSYQHLKNAHADFRELILTLEQTNARIRDYYALQIKKATTKIYEDFFDVYYGDIVEGYVFPTLVEDSLKRFKNPVLMIIEHLLADEAFLQKVVESAITHYRVSNAQQAYNQIQKMLYEMYHNIGVIENLTSQLVESDANYRKLAKQRILYLCNSDQGMKGKLVDLLHALKEKPEAMCKQVSQHVNIQKVGYIEKDEVYSFVKNKRVRQKERMQFAFEEVTQTQEQLEKRLDVARISKFTKENVVAYYEDKLHQHNAVRLQDIGIQNMDDYVRSILMYVYGKDRNMDLCADVLPGNDTQIEQEAFTYPNLLIRRKD